MNACGRGSRAVFQLMNSACVRIFILMDNVSLPAPMTLRFEFDPFITGRSSKINIIVLNNLAYLVLYFM